MVARQIIVPGAMPSRDANGRALPARLRFYLPDTTAPATVYADSGLTIPHAFPVLSDSAGRWPQLWAQETALFDVAWSDLAHDAPIASFADVGPLNSAVTASATVAEAAADGALDAAAAAAQSASSAADSLAQTQAFIEPFGNISAAVAAAQDAAGAATTSEAAAEAARTAAEAAAASAQNIGRHSIWVPAAGMVPRNTNGALVSRVELAANKVMLPSLDFDAATVEYAQFMLAMPRSWNRGAVSAVFVWSHASAGSDFKVSWGLQGLAASNDDVFDAAFGAAQYANDEGGTANDLYRSPETAAITIAGPPIAEDLVIFQVLRQADDAVNDALAADARLHGVVLYLTTEQGNDA